MSNAEDLKEKQLEKWRNKARQKELRRLEKDVQRNLSGFTSDTQMEEYITKRKRKIEEWLDEEEERIREEMDEEINGEMDEKMSYAHKLIYN